MDIDRMHYKTLLHVLIGICLLLGALEIAFAERGGAVAARHEGFTAERNRADVNRTTVNRNAINAGEVNRDTVNRVYQNDGVYVAPGTNVYVAPTVAPADCVWIPTYTDENGVVIPGHQSC